MSNATPSDTMRAYAQATVAADTAAISGLTDDQFTYVHSSALYETKEQLIAAFEGGRRYKGWDIQEMVERPHAGCTTVTGTAILTTAREGAPLLNIRFTTTMVQDGGGWKMAAMQTTRLPEQ
jgi:hypothetical protein